MKTINLKQTFVLLCFTAIISCQYETVVPFDYPGEKIYFPAAVKGVHTIDNLPEETSTSPTTGSIQYFTIDKAQNQFNIPLGVYRAGISAKGDVTATVTANEDTINTMILNGELENTELLASDYYTISTSTVIIKDGSNLSSFNLVIDLNFLKENAPDKKYAAGLKLESSEREVNPDYNTVVVVVDTKILQPLANFDVSADQSNPKKITFTNKSEYALSWSWDFGDGTVSGEKTPAHTYTQTGTYPVKLSVVGLYGDTVVAEKEVIINE